MSSTYGPALLELSLRVTMTITPDQCKSKVRRQQTRTLARTTPTSSVWRIRIVLAVDKVKHLQKQYTQFRSARRQTGKATEVPLRPPACCDDVCDVFAPSRGMSTDALYSSDEPNGDIGALTGGDKTSNETARSAVDLSTMEKLGTVKDLLSVTPLVSLVLLTWSTAPQPSTCTLRDPSKCGDLSGPQSRMTQPSVCSRHLRHKRESASPTAWLRE